MKADAKALREEMKTADQAVHDELKLNSWVMFGFSQILPLGNLWLSQEKAKQEANKKSLKKDLKDFIHFFK